MHYIISHGLINPLAKRIEVFAGAFMPSVAIAFIALALFSSNSFVAPGKKPHIDVRKPSEKSAALVPVSLLSPAGSGGGESTAAPGAMNTETLGSGAGGGQPSSNNLSGTTTTQTATGGRGGGTSLPTTTSSTSSGGSSGSTAPSGSTSGPLPATVTVPPVDLQGGGKTLLNSSGATLTIN